MRKAICVLGAAGFALLNTASFAQQPQTVRVRGTIEAVNGSVLTVKSRAGETLTVKLADNVNVVALVKASLADIKPGSFVGSAAMPEADGSFKAVEVHIFPESMRGTGEGDRPYDYKPKSTMTNGTVGTVGTVGSGGATTGTVGGEVAKTGGGATLTIKYKEGEKKIDVTPETPIVMYAPGSKDELKPGAAIYITAAAKEADGTLSTGRINVGRGVVPPM
jgi:hypothetical protein